ncbi:acyltransferase [Ruminococcus sp.]|uniref:acyltransferase family protein n=1 Tax=Ruminococcus sp. TaxID=41978 RepID=UPI0025DA0175|nr:acyltransferase [Ruminococcus sp.]
MSEKQTRNSTIDIIKLFCAVLVVFLHTVNTEVLFKDTIQETVRRIIYRIVWCFNPVEFFFIVSAYFFFKGNNFQNAQLKKLIIRLSVLYLFWSVLYLNYLFDPFANVKTVSQFAFAGLKMVRRLLFIGVAGHMWYVLSLLYGSVILWVLMKKGHYAWAWGFAVVCYLIALVADPYYHLFDALPLAQKIFDLIRATFGSPYLFRGPIFIMIGSCLVKKEKCKISVAAVMFAVMAILNNLEVIMIKNNALGLQCSTTVFKPITSYFFVLLCLNIRIDGKRSSAVVAKISTVMYFAHIFIRDLLVQSVEDMYLVWLLTMAICICLAVVLNLISKKFKKLNMIM